MLCSVSVLDPEVLRTGRGTSRLSLNVTFVIIMRGGGGGGDLGMQLS